MTSVKIFGSRAVFVVKKTTPVKVQESLPMSHLGDDSQVFHVKKSMNSELHRILAVPSHSSLVYIDVGSSASTFAGIFSFVRGVFRSMATEQMQGEMEETAATPLFPNQSAFQKLIHSYPNDGWEKCWEQGLTPWDLGRPTPIIQQLHQMGALPKGRALVPGCGTGYDVASIACPERYVVGIDISEIAVERAIQLFSSSPNANHFIFLKEDFFTWQPTELFDLIFDYTFFCAIEPEMRVAWAERMSGLLRPDGELITLMFPISDHIGGPPYKVSISDYEEVLIPLGFKAISIMDNELAVEPRKGKEKIGRWKKIRNNSSM